MQMHSQMSNGNEVAWDGRTVWVNSGEDGMSLGRFSRFGIDVHKTTKEQLRTGTQCLACSHGNGDSMKLSDWSRFRELMAKHHQTHIPEEATPRYLRK